MKNHSIGINEEENKALKLLAEKLGATPYALIKLGFKWAMSQKVESLKQLLELDTRELNAVLALEREKVHEVVACFFFFALMYCAQGAFLVLVGMG